MPVWRAGTDEKEGRFSRPFLSLPALLIASGADVKTVQARLRHASAKTTLDTYGHLWPDRDQSTRAAVDAVLADRAGYLRATAGPR